MDKKTNKEKQWICSLFIFSLSLLLPLKFKPPWFLDGIIVVLLDVLFLLLTHYNLFSTLWPRIFLLKWESNYAIHLLKTHPCLPVPLIIILFVRTYPRLSEDIPWTPYLKLDKTKPLTTWVSHPLSLLRSSP